MGKNGKFLCCMRRGQVIARIIICGAVIGSLFFGILHGMSTAAYSNSQRIERVRAQAEQQAAKMGKTALEVRNAGRAAATQEMAQAHAEWAEQQARRRAPETQFSGSKTKKAESATQNQETKNQEKNKEEKKEEEKEPENPVQAQVQQNQVRIISPEERKWAARYEGQQQQRFRVPTRFDDELTVRYGDYLVAWDEKQRKDRVLLCSTPTTCDLETADTIYMYSLQDGTWVMAESLD